MAKIFLSLKPLQDVRLETSPTTGAKYKIAPLSSERDAELQRECTDMLGMVNHQLLTEKICLEVLKGWEGIGGPEGELVCNEENVKLFVKWHGQSEGQFVVRRARSLSHYIAQEEGEAKKG